MKPKVLFLTSAHPGGRGSIGAGEGVSEGNLQVLLDMGYEVHVLCIARDNQSANPKIVELCAQYVTLRQTFWQSLMAVFSNVRNGSLVAPWLFMRVSPRNVVAVLREIRCNEISRIWIEFPSSLGFADKLSNFEVDYFVHDVVAQKVSRKSLLKLLTSSVRKVESRLISKIQCCHVMSLKDELLLRQLSFRGDISVEPPRNIKVGEVEGGALVARILERFAGSRNLVFFGNMGRPENHLSMMHFLLASYPLIRRNCPDVQLWILGIRPKWSLRLISRLLKGVHVTGPVDDPTIAFSAASICIAPLSLGAGVKIKVLQMLEAGARVVATPVGAEGIPASDRLIVSEMQNFAKTVIKELNAL